MSQYRNFSESTTVNQALQQPASTTQGLEMKRIKQNFIIHKYNKRYRDVKLKRVNPYIESKLVPYLTHRMRETKSMLLCIDITKIQYNAHIGYFNVESE